MHFLFLSHWHADRLATTERLALALARSGHSVVHAVAPTRNPFRVRRYSRQERPFASLQLWSPTAHMGEMRGLDVTLARRMLRRVLSDEVIVILQSLWMVPLAEAVQPAFCVYAAIDEYPWLSSDRACSVADAIFCVAPRVAETLTFSAPEQAPMAPSAMRSVRR